MLILTRKDGQSIYLDDKVEIKIISSTKGNVKIGIEAPKNMVILRSELIDDIKTNNSQASIPTEEKIENLSIKLKKWNAIRN